MSVSIFLTLGSIKQSNTRVELVSKAFYPRLDLSGGYGDLAYVVLCSTLVLWGLLANLVKGCAPPQQHFPKDIELVLGMTLLELQ